MNSPDSASSVTAVEPENILWTLHTEVERETGRSQVEPAASHVCLCLVCAAASTREAGVPQEDKRDRTTCLQRRPLLMLDLQSVKLQLLQLPMGGVLGTVNIPSACQKQEMLVSILWWDFTQPLGAGQKKAPSHPHTCLKQACCAAADTR